MSGERTAQHKEAHIKRQSHPEKTPLGNLELKCLNIGAPASHVEYTVEGPEADDMQPAPPSLVCLSSHQLCFVLALLT